MKTVDNKARKSSSSIIFGSDFVLFLFDVRYYKKKNRILLNCEREKKTSLRGICMKAYWKSGISSTNVRESYLIGKSCLWNTAE